MSAGFTFPVILRDGSTRRERVRRESEQISVNYRYLELAASANIHSIQKFGNLVLDTRSANEGPKELLCIQLNSGSQQDTQVHGEIFLRALGCAAVVK